MCVNLVYQGNSQAWSGTSTGATAGAAVGSIIPGVGTVIGGAVGALVGMFFSGNSEDTSAAGWENYINKSKCDGSIVKKFPTKAELLANAAKITGKAKSFLSNYNEKEGYLRDGDWIGQIIEFNPVVFKWFKGAGENFLDKTNWYWLPVELVPPYIPPSTVTPNPAQAIASNSKSLVTASNAAFNTPQSTQAGGAGFSLLSIPALIGGALILLIGFLIFRK